jgi:hypothetical protein
MWPLMAVRIPSLSTRTAGIPAHDSPHQARTGSSGQGVRPGSDGLATELLDLAVEVAGLRRVPQDRRGEFFPDPGQPGDQRGDPLGGRQGQDRPGRRAARASARSRRAWRVLEEDAGACTLLGDCLE